MIITDTDTLQERNVHELPTRRRHRTPDVAHNHRPRPRSTTSVGGHTTSWFNPPVHQPAADVSHFHIHTTYLLHLLAFRRFMIVELEK